jgi:hypothetical protein
MGKTTRFLRRGKIAAAIESGVMAALLAASVVTNDLPAESSVSAARPASSPSCDVICDGWITSSQP